MLSKPINYEIHKDAYYSIKQVAEKLGVSRETIYREMRDGNMKYTTIRSIWKVKGCTLLNYLNERSSDNQELKIKN